MVPKLFYVDGAGLVINANVSSAGAIQIRPTDLKQATLGTVKVTKE